MRRQAMHWDCGYPQCASCISVRFWQRVEVVDQCWEYRGYTNRFGYGRIQVDRRHEYAHRVAYRLMVAEIDPDLTLDHLCRNHACVRPEHLDPVPTEVNTQRAVVSRDVCRRKQHPYTDENTFYTKEGWRRCRQCNLDRRREKRLAHSERPRITALRGSTGGTG